ncbi:MAG: LptE family protein [Elusimicrobiota bacterium]
MFKSVKRVIVVVLGLAFAGCGEYTPQPQFLPQHVRAISVKNFTNRTVNFGLEEKLSLTIINQFIQDGRVQVANEGNADGMLSGEINRYILEPLSYDANHVVEEYKLWVLVNVTFTDLSNNQALWTEQNMEAETRFFVVSKPGVIVQTEQEARETVWDYLARDIVKRTIEGFGSVTGASERKVPGQQAPGVK